MKASQFVCRLAGTAALALALGLAAQAQAAICQTCDPPPPPAPTPAPPVVSQPDAMMQFSQCLPAGVGPFVVNGVRASVASALDALDLKDDSPPANPDVRTACSQTTGRETIAIWFAPVGAYGSWDTTQKRQAAIGLVSILNPGDQFAVRYRAAGIQRMVGVAWADVDKRMNLSGNPDPTGTIHLQGYKLSYFNSTLGDSSRKRVKLTVNGLLDSPFADIKFWGWASDSLRITSGAITCSTATGFDMEDSLEEAAASIFADPDTMVSKALKQGPGCKLAAAMPREVMLPSPPNAPDGTAFKQVFTYTRLAVTSAGITAGGTHQTQTRSPSVTISGPSIVRGDFDGTARERFKANTYDLRPPLTITWSSPNATIPSGRIVWATWDIPNHVLNMLYNRNLQVTVTDADGLVRTRNKAVKVKYVIDSQLPPICDLHPNHYECDIDP